MTDKQAGELISRNLTAIYGFAFARLYDKDKVEDLASEIIYEIMVSAKNIKNEDAFWGYAWKIAENTFKKFIRREQLAKSTAEYDANDFGIYEMSPEQAYIEKETENEQIYLLRRELSLLSKTHREVCVAYYVDQKSCSQIAEEQSISVEMVKYHLFKTRKLLKEGIGMTRKLGEKSYNPGTFRINFMGDKNCYDPLFQRRLPGAIALAAYDAPMTAEELSIELGVSMPYLEEEIDTLEAAGILKKNGTRYQTHMVIITDAYETAFEEKTKHIYPETADKIWQQAIQLLPEIRKINFWGNDYDDNRLLFAILNIAMVKGYWLALERVPMDLAPELPLGCHGRVWGHDNNYKNLRYRGVCMAVYNKAKTAWFSAENYKVIEKAQVYEHSQFAQKAEIMCDAVLGNSPDRTNETLPWLIEHQFVRCQNDRLQANFPVFDTPTFDRVCHILRDVIETVADCMILVSDKAATIMEETVPPSVKDQCAAIAHIHHRLDVAACLLENMISKGFLTIPSEKVPLCVWGVKA